MARSIALTSCSVESSMLLSVSAAAGSSFVPSWSWSCSKGSCFSFALPAGECSNFIPWRNVTLMMFNVRPTHPIIKISIGFSTSECGISCVNIAEMVGILWSDTNRSIDCRKMLTPSARRKTPLKKAPRSCALCQPNDSALGVLSRCEIWIERVGEHNR